VDSILSRADKALLDPDAIASILYTKSDRVSSNSSSSVAAKASYQGGLKRKSQNSGDGQKNHKKSSQSGKAETAKPAKRKKMCICGTGKHDEADCYHLHPEKLPESVKAMQKKLSAENNAKKVIMCSQVPCETAYLTIHRAFGAKSLQGFSKDSWIFDSGASKHMCHKFNAFTTYTAFDKKHIVELGDAHCISAHGVGSVNLISEVDGQLSLQLTEVLYVPDMQMNLLSQRCLDRNGCRTIIDRGIYSVFYKNSEILRSTSQTDLYYADVVVSYTKTGESDNDVVMIAAPITTETKSLYEWHCALGHTNIKNIKLLGNSPDSGIKVKGGGEMPLCEMCI
jgi:hypothetical protein